MKITTDRRRGRSPWPILVAALAMPARADGVPLARAVHLMGTTLEIEVEARDRGRAIAATDAVVAAVDGAERRLSTWNAESELARVNTQPPGKPFRPSRLLARDLAEAFGCRASTGGAFDPTVGPLVAAWGLRGAGALPSPTRLAAARATVGSGAFAFSAGSRARIIRLLPGAAIEEGGFGKGAGLDDAAEAVADMIARGDVAKVALTFGGQLLVTGSAGYDAAVAHPLKRDEAVLRWRVQGGHRASLSTSGNSEHRYEVGGRRFGHLLDPRTGAPAPFQGSVTIQAPRGALADCLSTALAVMGPNDGLAWLRARDGDGPVEAVYLSATGGEVEVRASCGLRGRIAPARSGVRISFEGCSSSSNHVQEKG